MWFQPSAAEASRNKLGIGEKRGFIRMNQKTLMLPTNYGDGQDTYSQYCTKVGGGIRICCEKKSITMNVRVP